MSKRLIDSTPAPIPISITPALILEAIVLQASSPLEHCLLIAAQVVVSGYPAMSCDARAISAPAPG